MERVTLDQPSRLIIKTSCASQTLPITCINHISSNQIILVLDSNITISVEPLNDNSLNEGGSCPVGPSSVLENLQDSGVESPINSQRKGSLDTGKSSENASSPRDPPTPMDEEESDDEIDDSSDRSESLDVEHKSGSDSDSNSDSVCSNNSSDDSDENPECEDLVSERLKRISSEFTLSKSSPSNNSNSSREGSEDELISISSDEVLYDSDSMHSSFHDDHLLQSSKSEKLDDSSEDSPQVTKDFSSNDQVDGRNSDATDDEGQIASEEDSSRSNSGEDSEKNGTPSDDGSDSDNEDDNSVQESESAQSEEESQEAASVVDDETSDQEESNKRNFKRRFEMLSASTDEEIASLHSERSFGVDETDRSGHDSFKKKRLRISDSEEEQDAVDDEIEEEVDDKEEEGIAEDDEEEDEEEEEEEDDDKEAEPVVVSEGEIEAEDSSFQGDEVQSQPMEESGTTINDDDDDCVILLSSDNEKAIEELECHLPTRKERADRHKSRRVLEEAELEKETHKATSAERKRNERVARQEKRYKQLMPLILKGRKGPRLILDLDLETKNVRVEVDPVLVQLLKKYQRDGIRFLYNATIESVDKLEEGDGGSGCILAHCMGLGKTFQIIAFVHTLLSNKFTKKYIKTILIAVPVNTLKNWVDEINKWITDKGLEQFHVHEIVNEKNIEGRVACLRRWCDRGGVLIIGHTLLATLLNLRTAKRPVSRWNIKHVEKCLAAPGPDVIIIDEGHVLKSPESRICSAVERMETQRKIILTGTPLQNNLGEYHTMVNIINPRLLGSKKEFANQFCNPIVNGQKADSNADDVRLMKQRATILHKLLSGCIQRFDYDTLRSHLEPKFEYALYIRPSKRMAQMYNYYLINTKCYKLFQDAATLRLCVNHPALYQLRYKRGNMNQVRGTRKRRKLTNTQSTANYSDEETEYDVSLNQDWYKKMTKLDDWKNIELSGKFVMLFKILRRCVEVNDKLVVVSQSLETLDLIENYLQSNERLSGGKSFKNFQWNPNKHYLRIDGSVNVRNRDERIKRFNDPKNHDTRLILLSTKAGGIGINLIAANRVIVFDVSWNPSLDNQAIFRVYRLGQNKPVYVYRFVTKDTMEEKIFRKQIFKIGTSMRVVDKTQVKRTFSTSELEEFYKARPKENYGVARPPILKDSLLSDLLHFDNNEVLECTEFAFLLEKKPEEELTEVERQAAWTEYQKKRDADIQIIDEILNVPEESVSQVKVKTENPNSEEMGKESGGGEPNNNQETAPTISEATESQIAPQETINQSPVQLSTSNSIEEIETPIVEELQEPAENNASDPASSEQLVQNENSQQPQTDDQDDNDCTSSSIASESSESHSFKLEQIPSTFTTSTNELPASKPEVWIAYRRRRLSLLSSDEEQTNETSEKIEAKSIVSENTEEASVRSPVVECREKGTLSAVQSAAPEAERVDPRDASPAPPPFTNESIITLIDAFQKTQTSEVTMKTAPEPASTMNGDDNSSSHRELSDQSQPSPSDDASFTPTFKFCALISPQRSSSTINSNQIEESVYDDQHVSEGSDIKNGERQTSSTKSSASRISVSKSPIKSRTSRNGSRSVSVDFDEWVSAESTQNDDDPSEYEVFQPKQDPLYSDHSIAMEDASSLLNSLQETVNPDEDLNNHHQTDEDIEMQQDEEFEKVTSECLHEIVETIVSMSSSDEMAAINKSNETHDETLNNHSQSTSVAMDTSHASIIIPDSAQTMTTESIFLSSTALTSEQVAASSLEEQITETTVADEFHDLRSRVSLLTSEQTKRTSSPSQLSLSTEPSSSSPSPTVSMSPPKTWVLWPEPRSESTPSPTSDDPTIAKLVEPYSEDSSEREDAAIIQLMPTVERSMDSSMYSDDERSLNTLDFVSSSDDEEEKPANWLYVSKVNVKSVLKLVALENGVALNGLETVLVFDCIYDEFGRHRHGIIDVEAEENCIKIHTESRESSINIKSELEAFNETKHLDFILSAELVYLNDPIIQFELEKSIDEADRSNWINNLKRSNNWDEESEVTWKGSQYIGKTRRHRISISVDSKIRSAIERESGTIRVGDTRISVIDKFDLVLCSTCLEYDHKAFDVACSGIKRCRFCAKRHRGECLFEDEPDQWFCHLCQRAGHSALSKNCPKLIEKLQTKLEAIDHHYRYIILGNDRIC